MTTHRAWLLLAVVQLLAHVQSKPTGPVLPHSTSYIHPSNGVCTEYTITQEVAAPVAVFDHAPFESNLDMSALLINATRTSTDGVTFGPVAGFQNVTRSYTISGTFCSPKEPKDGKETTVVVATHGVMYDRRYASSVTRLEKQDADESDRYWASSYRPDDYNFVKFALDHGYSVFYYDRLGTGLSEM
jgi:hypothetical protein